MRLAPAFALILLMGFAGASPAGAQALGFVGQGNQPILVEADDGIEWHKAELKYVAQGNASATQGDTQVRADRLTAYYEAGGGADANRIHRIDAEGHVRIRSTRDATGDRAVYNVKSGVLLLTGRQVELVTPQDRILADDTIEYHAQQQLAVARGNARATRGTQTLSADTLMAHYKERDAAGRKVSDVDRVDAIGNVVIVTPGETFRGERGDYDPATGIAHLLGDVRLTRGTTQLNGLQAEVNMNTGVARLIGGAGEGGRVRALIDPATARGAATEGAMPAPPSAAAPPTAAAPSPRTPQAKPQPPAKGG